MESLTVLDFAGKNIRFERRGDRFSSNTLATGKGQDNTSYQHTKWQESIVDVLRNLM